MVKVILTITIIKDLVTKHHMVLLQIYNWVVPKLNSNNLVNKYNMILIHSTILTNPKKIKHQAMHWIKIFKSLILKLDYKKIK